MNGKWIFILNKSTQYWMEYCTLLSCLFITSSFLFLHFFSLTIQSSKIRTCIYLQKYSCLKWAEVGPAADHLTPLWAGVENGEDHQRNLTDPALHLPASAVQVQVLARNMHMIPGRAKVQVFWSVFVCLCFLFCFEQKTSLDIRLIHKTLKIIGYCFVFHIYSFCTLLRELFRQYHQ